MALKQEGLAMENIEQRVKKIVAEQLGVKLEDVKNQLIKIKQHCINEYNYKHNFK